jgi:hypothetical protein
MKLYSGVEEYIGPYLRPALGGSELSAECFQLRRKGSLYPMDAKEDDTR